MLPEDLRCDARTRIGVFVAGAGGHRMPLPGKTVPLRHRPASALPHPRCINAFLALLGRGLPPSTHNLMDMTKTGSPLPGNGQPAWAWCGKLDQLLQQSIIDQFT